jgi:phosphatidylethanolamine/phosphatidyl-N-methylethanolamine N-methyltransferase
MRIEIRVDMAVRDLDRFTIETAYARWAPIYDAICGPVMVEGRRAAAARAIGGKILEVGVGTGLSFDDYDATTEITGIDLSAPMLQKARAKIASGRYPWVQNVELMDAHQMAFADATFDCLVAQFVIRLVANPEQVLSECHPRGEAGRADHPGQQSLFGSRRRRGGRAMGRAAHPRAGAAA